MLRVILVSLPTKSLFEVWRVRIWCISVLLPRLKASGSLPETLWPGIMWHTAQGWDFLPTDKTGVGNAHVRVTGETEVGNTSGYIWRHVEVAEISQRAKGAKNFDILQTRNWVQLKSKQNCGTKWKEDWTFSMLTFARICIKTPPRIAVLPLPLHSSTQLVSVDVTYSCSLTQTEL